MSSAPTMGDREGRLERDRAGHRRVLSATNSVEGECMFLSSINTVEGECMVLSSSYSVEGESL